MNEDDRPFPMLDGPPITWAIARVIYADYSLLYGQSQSLERIAERGGFGWGEVPLFAADAKKRRRA